MFARVLRLSIINNNYRLHPIRTICNHNLQIESNLKQNDGSGRRYYKNFAGKPEKASTFTKVFYSIILTGFVFSLIDFKW